jgi:hypothetical protein
LSAAGATMAIVAVNIAVNEAIIAPRMFPEAERAVAGRPDLRGSGMDRLAAVSDISRQTPL